MNMKQQVEVVNAKVCNNLAACMHNTIIQSSLQTKDTLGMGLLSFARRLSLSRRFMIFQSILIVFILKQVSKCTEMHDKSSKDDNQVVGSYVLFSVST